MCTVPEQEVRSLSFRSSRPYPGVNICQWSELFGIKERGNGKQPVSDCVVREGFLGEEMLRWDVMDD